VDVGLWTVEERGGSNSTFPFIRSEFVLSDTEHMCRLQM
jgi:hypothetical protein